MDPPPPPHFPVLAELCFPCRVLELAGGTGVIRGIWGAEERRESAAAKGSLPGDAACCAEMQSCLWTVFVRDYWILVTPGEQLLVPLPTLRVLNPCV